VFFNVGPAEVLVILFVALIVFGPHKLPEVGRQVGGFMKELRRMQEAVKGELDGVLNPDFTPASKTDDEEPKALEEPDHTVYHHPLSQPSDDADDGFAGPSDSFI
jgi:Tat protein translocase TatB subunit